MKHWLEKPWRDASWSRPQHVGSKHQISHNRNQRPMGFERKKSRVMNRTANVRLFETLCWRKSFVTLPNCVRTVWPSCIVLCTQLHKLCSSQWLPLDINATTYFIWASMLEALSSMAVGLAMFLPTAWAKGCLAPWKTLKVWNQTHTIDSLSTKISAFKEGED